MTEPHDGDRTAPQAVWDRVQEWLELAADDLRVAGLLLDADPPYRSVACHAQQAAEKYLKALLTHAQIEFGRSHDIDYLLRLLKAPHPDLGDDLLGAGALTPFVVAFRYPDLPPPPDRGQAAALVRLAQDVQAVVRRTLAHYLEEGRPE